MKKVEVLLWRDAGNSIEDGEYTIDLYSHSEPLDIWRPGGVDDVSLIADCIRNHIDEIELPEETMVCIELHESGEFEDVFWHKYYVIAGHKQIDFEDMS